VVKDFGVFFRKEMSGLRNFALLEVMSMDLSWENFLANTNASKRLIY